MRKQRSGKVGSFGSHLDELVKHFPHDAPARKREGPDARAKQDKRDIHALLFERAWGMDRQTDREG